MAWINHALPRPNYELTKKLSTSPAVNRAMLAVLFSLVACMRPASGMQPCPSESELFSRAKIVVEARAKSFSINESGLLVDGEMPTRMIRTDLEIKRVIKGNFSAKEATLYGSPLLPGPVRELAVMATIFGFGNEDTFEMELSRHQLADGFAAFSLSDCIYYKFPDFASGRN